MNITLNNRTKNFLRDYDTLLMVLIFAGSCTIITNGKWVDPQNLLNVISRLSIVGVLVLGQSIVLLTGQIDISLAAFLGLFCSIYAILFLNGYGIMISLLIPFLVILALGFLNGLLSSRTTIPSFVVTLGTMMIATSLTLYILGAARYVPQLRDKIYNIVIVFPRGRELFPVVIWIITFIVLFFMLESTQLGKHIYAVGGNERVALITGVSTRNIKFYAFIFSSLMVIIASFLYLYRVSHVAPSIGGSYLLDTFAAPIIGGISLFGGRGKLWKAMMGALFLETLTNFMRLVGVNPYIFPGIKGGIIAVGVILSIILTPAYLRTKDL